METYMHILKNTPQQTGLTYYIHFAHKIISKIIRNVSCLALCFCFVLLSLADADIVWADKKQTPVTFSQLNDDSVFLKQSQAHVCTLTSSAMMIRRAAMLSGDDDWEDITEQSVRKDAWVSGVGLKWNFTVSGITVVHRYLSSKTELIRLLDKHPEGIVIYNPGRPHAVLATDYTDGVFYCSDPSNGSPSGRYPISQASITVESVSRCWYVKRPVDLTVVRDDIEYEAGNLLYRILDVKEKTAVCLGMAKDSAKAKIPDTVQLDGEKYRVVGIADNAFANSAKLKTVTIGANVTSIEPKAFFKCKKLKKVVVQSSDIQEIGADAFAKIYKDAEILLFSETKANDPENTQESNWVKSHLKNQEGYQEKDPEGGQETNQEMDPIEAFTNLLAGTSIPDTVRIALQVEEES